MSWIGHLVNRSMQVNAYVKLLENGNGPIKSIWTIENLSVGIGKF